MTCFCRAATRGGWFIWNVFTVEWASYSAEDEEPPNYCLKWLGQSVLGEAIGAVTGTSAVIMNGLIATAFSHLSKFKKKHTTIEEQSTGFG